MGPVAVVHFTVIPIDGEFSAVWMLLTLGFPALQGHGVLVLQTQP
jgi:hypothetical protein